MGNSELKPCHFCGELPKETVCFNEKCIEHSDNSNCPLRKKFIPINDWNNRYAERSHLVPLNELEVTKLLMKVKDDYDNLTDFEKVRFPIGCDGPRLYAEAICKKFGTPNIKCDREIDREALADKIMEINFESYGFSHEEVAYKTADKIIYTMPTWLRKGVRNEKI